MADVGDVVIVLFCCERLDWSVPAPFALRCSFDSLIFGCWIGRSGFIIRKINMEGGLSGVGC